MIGRVTTLLAMLAGASVLAFTIGVTPAPVYVWNASGSVPLGLYRVRPAGKLSVTDLVAVLPPEPLARFLAEGGYLPSGVPMLKRVLALPGQMVCREGLTVAVDRIAMGEARERDRRGRKLPVWQGCRVVARSELFLMNWQSPDSLDGRYFGPISATTVIGRALPIWTDEEDRLCKPCASNPPFLCSAICGTIPPSRPKSAPPSRAVAVQGGRQAGAPALHPGRARARWHAGGCSGRS
jgi:conjugative transfer signal peptidase TraF